MTKLKFLLSLHDKLSALPQDEVEERLNFYSEMIEDRMEEGLSEEEAVSAVGSIDEIAAQILGDNPPAKPEKEQPKPAKAWTIVLLILGSPIWLSLLIAAFAVILSLYISLWSVVISLWAVFASFIACAFAGILAGLVFAISGHRLSGITMIAAGLVCAGLSILLLFGCKAATEGTAILAKKAVLYVKNRFIRKEVI